MVFSFRLSFKRKDTKKKNSGAPNALQLSTSNASASQAGQTNGNGSSNLDAPNSPAMMGPMPAKFIRATNVKSRTLNPKWHERFRLYVSAIFIRLLEFLGSKN